MISEDIVLSTKRFQRDNRHCSIAGNQICSKREYQTHVKKVLFFQIMPEDIASKVRLTLKDENSRFCPPINEFECSFNTTSNNDYSMGGFSFNGGRDQLQVMVGFRLQIS